MEDGDFPNKSSSLLSYRTKRQLDETTSLGVLLLVSIRISKLWVDLVNWNFVSRENWSVECWHTSSDSLTLNTSRLDMVIMFSKFYIYSIIIVIETYTFWFFVYFWWRTLGVWSTCVIFFFTCEVDRVIVWFRIYKNKLRLEKVFYT